MAQLPKTVRNFTAFIDGDNLAGQIEKATLPDIGLETEEHTGGGMAGTVDVFMGMIEKMSLELEVTGMSEAFLAKLGERDLPITLRGAISDGTTTQAAVFQTRGMYTKAGLGELAVKNKGMTKITGTPHYFKATIGGVDVVEVDVIGGRFIVDGVDRLREQRAALGG